MAPNSPQGKGCKLQNLAIVYVEFSFQQWLHNVKEILWEGRIFFAWKELSMEKFLVM